jgi:hypothetical protein
MKTTKNMFCKKPKAILFFLGLIAFVALSCESDKSFDNASDTGVGGSTSRFTIVGNYLYVVDNQNLRIINIQNPSAPNLVKVEHVGFGIETIFPHGNFLFLGSRSAMFVYDINDAVNPLQLARVSHVYSCDPVVADDNYAFVTLYEASSCRWGARNELQVIDIRDLSNAQVVNTMQMDGPRGLAIKNNLLFICDADQVEVYDRSDVHKLTLLYTIDQKANDIIVLDNILFLVTSNGMLEYNYDGSQAQYLSSIHFTQ